MRATPVSQLLNPRPVARAIRSLAAPPREEADGRTTDPRIGGAGARLDRDDEGAVVHGQAQLAGTVTYDARTALRHPDRAHMDERRVG
jgi:hypothetical protein